MPGFGAEASLDRPAVGRRAYRQSVLGGGAVGLLGFGVVLISASRSDEYT